MFGKNRYDLEENKSPYLSYGRQELTITGFEIKVASTKAQQVLVQFESRKVESSSFTPADNAKYGGRVGKVKMGIYMSTKEHFEEFERNIQMIAKVLGVLDELLAIQATDLEAYLEQVTPLFSGKYAWFIIGAEEYYKGDKLRHALFVPRHFFVSHQEKGLKAFDTENKYVYKKAQKPDAEATEEVVAADEDDF